MYVKNPRKIFGSNGHPSKVTLKIEISVKLRRMLSSHVLVPIALLTELSPANFTGIGPLVRVNPTVIVEGVRTEEPLLTYLKHKYIFK